MASVAISALIDVVLEAVVDLMEDLLVEAVEDGVITKSMEEIVADTVMDAADLEIQSTVTVSVDTTVAEMLVTAIVTKALIEKLSKAVADNLARKIEDITFHVSRSIVAEITGDLERLEDAVLNEDLFKALAKLNKLQQANDDDDDDGEPPDCCKLLEEMKGFEGALFTVFAISLADGDIVRYTSIEVIKDDEIKSLLEIPTLRPFVQDVISRFSSTADDSVPTGPSSSTTAKPVVLVKVNVKRKSRKIQSGVSLVGFGNIQVYNVSGSSADRWSRGGWIRFWEHFIVQLWNPTLKPLKKTVQKQPCVKNGNSGGCFIKDAKINHNKPIVGGHMERKSESQNVKYWYMLPICNRHNRAKIHDRNTGTSMKTTSMAWAIRFPKPKGWVNLLTPEMVPPVTAFPLPGTIRRGSTRRLPNAISSNIEGTGNTLFDPVEVKKALNLFSLRGKRMALGESIQGLMQDVQTAVSEAGHDAQEYAEKLGEHIKHESMIPIYGWIKGPVDLSKMKSRCLDHFHSVLHAKVDSAIHKYEHNSKTTTAVAKVIRQSSAWKKCVEYLSNRRSLDSVALFYLATSSANSHIGIFEFDVDANQNQLQVLADPFGDVGGGQVKSVAWTTIHGVPYLATGQYKLGGHSLVVRNFDPSRGLEELPDTAGIGQGWLAQCLSVSWTSHAGVAYLAVGGQTSDKNGTARVWVYKFLPPSTLQYVGYDGAAWGDVKCNSVSWTIIDGIYYLIAGRDAVVNSRVFVYQFDPVTTSNALTLVATIGDAWEGQINTYSAQLLPYPLDPFRHGLKSPPTWVNWKNAVKKRLFSFTRADGTQIYITRTKIPDRNDQWVDAVGQTTLTGDRPVAEFFFNLSLEKTEFFDVLEGHNLQWISCQEILLRNSECQHEVFIAGKRGSRGVIVPLQDGTIGEQMENDKWAYMHRATGVLRSSDHQILTHVPG